MSRKVISCRLHRWSGPLMVLAALLLVLLLSQPAGSHVTAYTAGQPVLNSVVVYGDTRAGTAIHQGIVNQMIPLRPDAVFNDGDLVDDGTSVSEMAQFDAIIAPLRSISPYYAAIGNHDAPATLLMADFNLSSRWYRVDIGDLHFIVLDSTTSDLSQGSTQYVWLVSQLQSITTGFIFLVFHHPLLSSGAEHGSTLSLAHLIPLCEQYHVNIVFNGHDHDYERSFKNGVYYIVTGGGGAHLYPLGTLTPYSQVFKPVNHFSLLSESGGVVTVKAIDTAGNVIDQFATAASAGDTTPSAAVADLTATAATSNSVTLTWTAPGDDGNTGTASTYDIRYSTTTMTDGNWGSASQCSGETAPKVAGSAETFTVTGLSPDTTYYFAMKTADEVPNWSGLSNVPSQKTETTETQPPAVITNAATGIGIAGATLNGNLTSLGTAASVSMSFQWGTTTSYGSETSAQSVAAIGIFGANLTGLSANTTYHFKAKAVGDGSAVYGDDMTFTTANLADTTAQVISSTNSSGITVSGVTITWSTNEPGTSLVEYGLTAEYGSSTTIDYNLVNSHSVDLTRLKAGKTYHYRVISKDAANNAAVSADATFTTTARSGGGLPTWAWIIIVLVGVGVVGGAGYLIGGRLAKH
jgi:hypothetical protein